MNHPLRQVEGLESAVLNNVGNIVCFQVGYHDAVRLAPIMFAADTNAVKEKRFRIQTFGGIPFPYEEKIYRPLVEVKEQLIQRLTTPNPRSARQARHFWYKNRTRGWPAQLCRTVHAPSPDLSAEEERALRQVWETSGRKYGRLKDDVAEEIRRRRRAGEATTGEDKTNEQTVWEAVDLPESLRAGS